MEVALPGEQEALRSLPVSVFLTDGDGFTFLHVPQSNLMR